MPSQPLPLLAFRLYRWQHGLTTSALLAAVWGVTVSKHCAGAHAMGRCHSDRSGFSGPWTNAPTTFSNLYFTEMLEKKW